MTTTHDPEVVRATGILLNRLTPAQVDRVRVEAAARGWYPTEYLRRRLVPHMRKETS